MQPIAVFYHTRLFGGEPTTPSDWAAQVMADQMQNLKDSGLLDACQEFIVCSNGNDEEAKATRLLCPEKAVVVSHGEKAKSHLPTIDFIRRWLPGHKDWYICYFHIKGSTHPGDVFYQNWRKCMQRHVITNWKTCVADLDGGFESVGAHWLTPAQYGGIVPSPFWGGSFWWAKESLLSGLPELPVHPESREQWFWAERWIGSNRGPYVKDYAPHWPNPNDCAANA